MLTEYDLMAAKELLKKGHTIEDILIKHNKQIVFLIWKLEKKNKQIISAHLDPKTAKNYIETLNENRSQNSKPDYFLDIIYAKKIISCNVYNQITQQEINHAEYQKIKKSLKNNLLKQNYLVN